MTVRVTHHGGEATHHGGKAMHHDGQGHTLQWGGCGRVVPQRKFGEVAQWLRTIVALTEDPSLVPSTHIVIENSSFRGSDALLGPPRTSGTHVIHRWYMCRQNTHIK